MGLGEVNLYENSLSHDTRYNISAVSVCINYKADAWSLFGILSEVHTP
jgi:hypothetical protein